MKKFITLFAVVALMTFSFNAKAQVNFGIKGGLNYTSFSDINTESFAGAVASIKGYAGFNVGLALQIELPLGLALQPELVYSQSGSKFVIDAGVLDMETVLTQGNLELPVHLQWGIKLGPIKPFVQVSPFVGYNLKNSLKVGGEEVEDEELKEIYNKLTYGVGLGVGIQIWKIQLSGRYRWNLGNVADIKETGLPAVSEMFDKTKINGFEIAAAILF